MSIDNDIPFDVQMSLTAADQFLARQISDILKCFAERNSINTKMFEKVVERLNSQRDIIDQQSICIDLQRQMIDVLSTKIDLVAKLKQ